MILTFVVYCSLVSGLLAAAAAAGDRAARLLRIPTRWPWLAAIAGACLIPVLSLIFPSVDVWGGALRVYANASDGQETVVVGFLTTAARFDRVVGIAWIGLTFLTAGAFTAAVVGVASRRRTWRPAILAGRSVWVSDDLGPAVFGFFRPHIVVPKWVVGADRRLQDLMLRHEEEHIRAHDPLLVWLGGLAVALMPWNMPLWWMAWCIRIAAEVDCDARVLTGRSADVRLYGNLLIEVGRRTTISGFAAAFTAFAHDETCLEKRIRAMTPEPKPRQRGQAIVLTTVAAIGIALAMATPRPVPEWCQAQTKPVRRTVVLGVMPGAVVPLQILPPSS